MVNVRFFQDMTWPCTKPIEKKHQYKDLDKDKKDDFDFSTFDTDPNNGYYAHTALSVAAKGGLSEISQDDLRSIQDQEADAEVTIKLARGSSLKTSAPARFFKGLGSSIWNKITPVTGKELQDQNTQLLVEYSLKYTQEQFQDPSFRNRVKDLDIDPVLRKMMLKDLNTASVKSSVSNLPILQK